MATSRLRIWLGHIGLCLALGVLLLSVRRFVLYSGLYGMDLGAPATGAEWVVEYLTLCIYSAFLLTSYALLDRKRQGDASFGKFCLIALLCFGGLLGVMGTMAAGWTLGLTDFTIGGSTSALMASLLWGGGSLIVWTGQHIDRLMRSLCKKEG